MTIIIPAWALWTAGGIIVGVLALLGLLFLWLLWKGRKINFRLNW